jgi:hypothetical protein
MATIKKTSKRSAPIVRLAPMPAAGAPIHPAARLFPDLSQSRYAALKEDIQINGVREPIWIDYKGRILDGRHRLRAAHETGKTCTTYIYDDPDPLGFVVSLNFHRRHLTNRERAEIAAKIENFGHGGNRRARSRKMPSGSLKRTRAEAAKLMNVSARSVARAKARQKTGASPGRRAPATTPKPTKAVIKPSAKKGMSRRLLN